jgi:IPT/TIG domain
MSEVTHAAALATVTDGWRWLAVGIGLFVLLLAYVFAAIPHGWNPWKLVQGADGRPSTSKFQWLLWIIVIVFSYTALWVLRAKQGDYSAINEVPVNLLTVLGFSTGTAAVAKGITAGYVNTNRLAKTAAGNAGAGATNQGGLLQDDSGVPELAKIQLFGFTFVAVGIFLATVIHQIVSNPVVTSLPNLDSALLVLMGISQGGYLGKKLVTFNTPTLYPPVPSTAAPGDPVTLSGANLGSPSGSALAPAGARLTIDSIPIPITTWSDSAIKFAVPETSPAGGAAPWPPPKPVQLAAVVGGQTSNPVSLTVGNST